MFTTLAFGVSLRPRAAFSIISAASSATSVYCPPFGAFSLLQAQTVSNWGWRPGVDALGVGIELAALICGDFYVRAAASLLETVFFELRLCSCSCRSPKFVRLAGENCIATYKRVAAFRTLRTNCEAPCPAGERRVRNRCHVLAYRDDVMFQQPS